MGCPNAKGARGSTSGMRLVRCRLAEERSGLPEVWVGADVCADCKQDPSTGYLAKVVAYKLHLRIVGKFNSPVPTISVGEAATRLLALTGAARVGRCLVAAVDRGMPAAEALTVAEALGLLVPTPEERRRDIVA